MSISLSGVVVEPLQIGLPTGWEWVLILVVILLLFGARKIPELARSLGRARGELERGRKEVEKELKEAEPSPQEETPRQRLEKAAKALGIDAAGKTDEELRDEIQKILMK